jgi:hypothetical protein
MTGKTDAQNMAAPSPTMGDVGTAVVKGTQELLVNPVTIGTARGATAGLFDYIPAGMMTAIDRLKGKGKLSADAFNQNLSGVRGVHTEMRQAHPVAMGTGEVVGGTGLAIATGGGSIARQAGVSGAQGAISKYTESPETTAKEALIQGGITGAVGATGAAVGKGVTKVIDKFKGKTAMPMEEFRLARYEEKVADYMAKNGGKAPPTKIASKMEMDANAEMIKAYTPEGIAIRTLNEGGSIVKEGVTNVVKGAAYGGGAGAVHGLLTTGDPISGGLHGAALGAAGAAGATKFQLGQKIRNAGITHAGVEAIKKVDAPKVGNAVTKALVAPIGVGVSPTLQDVVMPKPPEEELRLYSAD